MNTSNTSNTLNTLNTFVARQPILDRSRRLAGYELLYRSSDLAQAYDATDGDRATSRVLANCLFTIGLDRLAAGQRLFINFTRELLVHDFASVLPPEAVVIEILETVEPDNEVINACRMLKRQGYRLALDDFVLGDSFEKFIPFVDIIKVDFQATDEAAQRELANRCVRRGVTMLAEKVETSRQFEYGCSIGYTYFQGYFFARAAIVKGKDTATLATHHMRLLNEVQQSPIDYKKLELLIRRDVSFAYKLLRYLNSARFAWSGRIESIRHGLLLLGDEEIRKWVALVVAYGLVERKPRELVVLAVVRARFCELLGQFLAPFPQESDLFLMGLFSLLDAMMDRPIEDILAGITLDEEVKAALVGSAPPGSRLALIYGLVRAYERGEWQAVAAQAQELGVPEESIPAIYADSVTWSEEALRA